MHGARSVSEVAYACGFESLAIPVRNARVRMLEPFDVAGPMLRLSIGLEDPDDLVADLERGFAALGH